VPPRGRAGHRVAAIKSGIVNAAYSRAVAFSPGIEIAIRPTVAERAIRITVWRPLGVSARGGEGRAGQREAERHGGCRDEIYPRPIHFHLRLDDFVSNEMTQPRRSRNCTQGDATFMLVQSPGTLAQTGPSQGPQGEQLTLREESFRKDGRGSKSVGGVQASRDFLRVALRVGPSPPARGTLAG
jgi:hypothetical protein